MMHAQYPTGKALHPSTRSLKAVIVTAPQETIEYNACLLENLSAEVVFSKRDVCSSSDRKDYYSISVGCKGHSGRESPHTQA